MAAVELEPPAVRDEHRHPRAILALEKHLPGLVSLGIEIDLWLAQQRALAGLDVVAIDRRRGRVAGEPIERLAIFAAPAESAGRADAGQFDFPQQLAGRVEHLDLRLGVLEIQRDEAFAHEVDILQDFVGLRDDFLPIGPLRLRHFDGDQAAARGIEIGAEVEFLAVVADEGELRIEAGNEFDDLGIVVGTVARQILDEHLILSFRSTPHTDYQVAAVVGHAAGEAPLLFVRPLVDECVFFLLIAEAMVIELLKVIRAGKLFVLFRLVVTAVVKALVVGRPRNGGKLDPLEVIAQVLAGRHVEHFPLLPVGPGGG